MDDVQAVQVFNGKHHLCGVDAYLLLLRHTHTHHAWCKKKKKSNGPTNQSPQEGKHAVAHEPRAAVRSFGDA